MKTKIRHRIILSCFLLLAGGQSIYANRYTVTSTVDNTSAGSLRWAINQANANAGKDTILFNIGTLLNTIETSGLNSWAVITLGSALPVITGPLLIDGSSQNDTNTGFLAGRTVGVDGFVQGNINYPDVYITCGYTLPSDDVGTTGNGLSINSPDVTVRNIAISGFGNRATTQPPGIAHADISIMYSATPRTMNTVIEHCFISCNPRGAAPSTTARTTKGNGILILANNNFGTIHNNLVSFCGGYGIVSHATQDNIVSTSPDIAPMNNWLVEENMVINIGNNAAFTSGGGRAADGISLMSGRFCLIKNNYVENWEQFGIDMGHNADDNKIENNTVTGFTKTNGSAPCGAIRTGFSSERDTIIKNVIFNNNTTVNLAGFWSDMARTTFAGAVTKDTDSLLVIQNRIHNNRGSGIVLSTNIGGSAGTLTAVRISQNSCYSNTGLGIDIGFTNFTGPTAVTANDNGDADNGINNLQNFPVIDSSSYNANWGLLTIYGKAPAGAIVEFFISDNETNSFGLGLNYGEGRTFIGMGTEGSATDYGTGTGSYAFDGSTAVNNVNMFIFQFYTNPLLSTDRLTATATVNYNTSEYGPQSLTLVTLANTLLSFKGHLSDNRVRLDWNAFGSQKLAYFVVEESTDGKTFYTVGEERNIVAGREHAYSYALQQTGGGLRYYRLKAVNKDGSFAYSNVIELGTENRGSKPVQVMPNPVTDRFTTQLKAEENDQIEMKIINSSGYILRQTVRAATKGLNTVTVDKLGTLPKGIYIVEFKVGNQTYSETFLKR